METSDHSVISMVIEQFGLERTFTGHLVQALYNELGHLQPDQAAPSSLTLNVSWNGTSDTPGHHGQSFTILIVKIFFLLSNINPPFFSVKPLTLVLSQQALLKC